MATRLTLVLLFAALVSGCASSELASASPLEGLTFDPSKPAPEHDWLHQLVGSWEVTSEADMGPDAPPMVMTSTETVRSVGGLWIQSELVSEHEGWPVSEGDTELTECPGPIKLRLQGDNHEES